MNNIVLKQFSEGRLRSVFTEYTKIIGHKNCKILDQIIPSLSNNLLKSTESFIEAVFSLDKEFLEETATLALQKKLLGPMEDARRSQVEIKPVNYQPPLAKQLKPKNVDLQNDQVKRFVISPYVIFGQTMAERLKLLSPWQSMTPIFGLNRHIFIDPVQGFSWQKLKNDHIYGFHCHYHNMNKIYEITQGSNVTTTTPKEFIVTFETDAVNHEFYVADFNYIVRFEQ